MLPVFFMITTFILSCLCGFLVWSGRRQIEKEAHEAFNRGTKYGYQVATDVRRAKEAAMRKRAAKRSETR